MIDINAALGADATEAITPTITVPAATAGGDPLTYTCNPFPVGVTEASILCPSALNTAIGPGTASLNFVGGDTATPGYYTGAYAFSVVTLATVSGGGGGTSATTTTTTTTTLSATTTTISGSCASASGRHSGTIPNSGSGFSSRPTASSGSGRPSFNSTIPIPTGTSPTRSSLRPSGSIVPSGSVSSSRSNSTKTSGTGTGLSTRSLSGTGPLPSGSGSSGKPLNSLSTASRGYSSGSGSFKPSATAGVSTSNILTITNPSVSTTSTSTHYITTTLTAVITTYVPCSSAIATQGGSTVYSNSLSPSVITKTITSVMTEYTVICPLTAASSGEATGQSGSDQSPYTTIVITKIQYVCPTTPPPSCATAAPKLKREAGFDGPDYTLSGGDTGPTITKGASKSVSTVTETKTAYSSTVTATQSCSTNLPEDGSRRGTVTSEAVKT